MISSQFCFTYFFPRPLKKRLKTKENKERHNLSRSSLTCGKQYVASSCLMLQKLAKPNES